MKGFLFGRNSFNNKEIHWPLRRNTGSLNLHSLISVWLLHFWHDTKGIFRSLKSAIFFLNFAFSWSLRWKIWILEENERELMRFNLLTFIFVKVGRFGHTFITIRSWHVIDTIQLNSITFKTSKTFEKFTICSLALVSAN